MQTGSALSEGPLGVCEGISLVSFLGIIIVFPLLQLGVVGSPETATLNMLEISESMNDAGKALMPSVLGVVADAFHALSTMIDPHVTELPR